MGMNGERSADLKTPRMCVLRPRLASQPPSRKNLSVRPPSAPVRPSSQPQSPGCMSTFPYFIPTTSHMPLYIIPTTLYIIPTTLYMGNGTFVLWELTVNIQCCLVESKHKTL